MSMPFYVSPEQVMADKAEFSRKGIARGKSSLVIECDIGILMMAGTLNNSSYPQVSSFQIIPWAPTISP